MSVPDWVGRNERDALEALANATVLTVMIGQGPQADGHVSPVRYTGFVLGEPDFEAARAFLCDALTFKQHSARSPLRCRAAPATNPERTKGAAAAAKPPTFSRPATPSLIEWAHSLLARKDSGSVWGVLQKPAVAGGHGVLVMGDITDPGKVARHDREGCYARNR